MMWLLSTENLSKTGEVPDAEYFQLKFHVDYNGAFTCSCLSDPRFINATEETILKRLHAAYIDSLGKERCLFNIISPWPIDPKDKLAKLVDTANNKIRLNEVLFNPRNRDSSIRKIKDEMMVHIGLSLDNTLYEILRSLRIVYWPQTLQDFQRHLNVYLRDAGLKPVDENEIINPYDDLIRKLHQAGRNTFNRDDIIEVIRLARLWLGRPETRKDTLCLGIRSFRKWAEYMEDDTSSLLLSSGIFDNRKLKKEYAWAKHIIPEVKSFLESSLKDVNSCELILDAILRSLFRGLYIKLQVWQESDD